MDKFKFGEYIYKKRKKLGLTQEELGKKIGVTNKAVSKWEVGETFPDITMLEPLARVLEVSLDELLTYTDKVEVEAVNTKINKKMFITIIILGILELLTLIFLIISLVGSNNKAEIIKLNNDNIKEAIDINPSSQVICDGETLIIDSIYKLNPGYQYVDDETISFTIVFQFQYYYYLKDGSVGVVTYYNRFYNINLSSENQEETINVLLEPKFNIDDFKGFNQVKIDYIVLDASGSLEKLGSIEWWEVEYEKTK